MQEYVVKLSEAEMQAIVDCVSGFYNRVNQEKTRIDPVRTAALLNAFNKFKEASKPLIVSVHDDY